MNIKIRLAFQFMLVVAGILLFFAGLVFYFTYTSHRDKFRSTLLNRAKNTAIIMVSRQQIDTALLKNIHESTFESQNQEIMITDTNFKTLYTYNTEFLTTVKLPAILKPESYGFFTMAGKDGIFYRFQYKQTPTIIFFLAFDNSRNIFLHEFRQILFWGILFSLWLSALTSYFLSRRAFMPVMEIIKNVKDINSSSLSKRLDEGKRKDELEMLAMTFNEMLADLEVAFKNQEDFVSNASHELRTPLSVLIVESDYLLGQDRTPEEYKAHISDLVIDMKKLNIQLNSLLELAQINSSNTLPLQNVRIDEIIFESILQVKNRFKGRKIIPKIQYPENENDLLIHGNAGMLTIALKNLIENACKFSDNEVNIEVALTDEFIKLNISDTGIGIPSAELEIIYKPFTRASNAKFKSGFGIGLSLVARILEVHEAILETVSTENEGTRFEILFKRLTLTKQ